MSTLLRVAISIGDPAGIGPEVVLKALRDDSVRPLASWFVIGDAAALAPAEEQCDIRLAELPGVTIHDLAVLPGRFECGQLNAACGRAAVAYVKRAAELCLKGEAEAMVTAPLNKEAVTLSGIPFTGHTEFIAELCGVSESRMLLANERLRVLHVTTHCSLREACEVSAERIVSTIRLGREALSWLGFTRARIAVYGLNPHAGENGLFGSEDARIIAPAIAAARQRGVDCHGPLPADTVFLRAVRGEFDLVVAMYHDQGHIPAKLLDFDRTVNVSLGLPIIRTSVDHGTAYDIAGQNKADAENMKAALRMAVRLAQHRRANLVEAEKERPVQP